jgi:hypothetical protein
MPRNHFYQFLRCICFGDEDIHEEQREDDKLAPNPGSFEMFVEKFRLSYVPQSMLQFTSSLHHPVDNDKNENYER